MYREGRMQDGRCREMVLRKGNGGDANVSLVMRGEITKKGWKLEKTEEEIFKRRGIAQHGKIR